MVQFFLPHSVYQLISSPRALTLSWRPPGESKYICSSNASYRGFLWWPITVADPGGMWGMRPATPQLGQKFFWTTIFWACMIVNVLQHQVADNAPVDVNNKSIFH